MRAYLFVSASAGLPHLPLKGGTALPRPVGLPLGLLVTTAAKSRSAEGVLEVPPPPPPAWLLLLEPALDDTPLLPCAGLPSLPPEPRSAHPPPPPPPLQLWPPKLVIRPSAHSPRPGASFSGCFITGSCRPDVKAGAGRDVRGGESERGDRAAKFGHFAAGNRARPCPSRAASQPQPVVKACDDIRSVGTVVTQVCNHDPNFSSTPSASKGATAAACLTAATAVCPKDRVSPCSCSTAWSTSRQIWESADSGNCPSCSSLLCRSKPTCTLSGEWCCGGVRNDFCECSSETEQLHHAAESTAKPASPPPWPQLPPKSEVPAVDAAASTPPGAAPSMRTRHRCTSTSTGMSSSPAHVALFGPAA
mmetsp:Transcript_91051/g.294002  ORF Transcript_91051/g.294002 Transcript_91051/m.294002 type:complete len:362 (+) Transcript_91051:372-1457(+)